MSDKIVLAWTVNVANTPFGPVAASAALAAVPLYIDTTTDPVLGQLFGLTVESDVMTNDAVSATRTLTLNMTTAGTRKAPPPFPCHPRTSTPPVLPYPLRSTKTLAGFFFVSNGSMVVQTSATQKPSLAAGDSIQFLSQEGVFYTVAAVGSTSINLTAPYTGTTTNTTAFKEVTAPTTNAALYSSSPLDTAGVSTTPAIAAGPGARTVSVVYKDSTGGGPFTVTVSLTGKRPAAVPLAMGSVDIAEIENIIVATTGSFNNSVGQITLVELDGPLPAISALRTADEFPELTDEAQLLIGRTLAYLPPSYFALSQQSASTPPLVGDFLVTTGSKSVPTLADQTGTLASGNKIVFASQPDTVYTIDKVSPKIVLLTSEYTGLERRPYIQLERRIEGGPVINQATGAYLFTHSDALPPTANQLKSPLAQFVQTDTAMPPPNLPLDPATATPPTFLSGLFTQTLQLALAVPVVPKAIVLV